MAFERENDTRPMPPDGSLTPLRDGLRALRAPVEDELAGLEMTHAPIVRGSPSLVVRLRRSRARRKLDLPRIESARLDGCRSQLGEWTTRATSSASISSVNDVGILGDWPITNCYGEHPLRRRWLQARAIADGQEHDAPRLIGWLTMVGRPGTTRRRPWSPSGFRRKE